MTSHLSTRNAFGRRDVERSEEEGDEEYISFEQHLLERETIVSSFQRILDTKAAQFEKELRLRYSRQEQRQRHLSINDLKVSEGEIVHKPPPQIFPHLKKHRQKGRPENGISSKVVSTSVTRELTEASSLDDTDLLNSRPDKFLETRLGSSKLTSTGSSTSATAVIAPEIVFNLNRSTQEKHSVTGQDPSQSDQSTTLDMPRSAEGVPENSSPLQGFAPSVPEMNLSAPSSHEGASQHRATVGAKEGSQHKGEGSTTNTQVLSALSSTLAANRRKSKNLPGSSSSSFVFGSNSFGTSSEEPDVLKRRAEEAHQKLLDEAVVKKQQELDTKEESELERLRSTLLSKQDRLQKLQQEAFFIGLKQSEVDEALGKPSRGRKPPSSQSTAEGGPLHTPSVLPGGGLQGSRLPSMMSENEWDATSDLFTIEDDADSQVEYEGFVGDDEEDMEQQDLQEVNGQNVPSKARKSLKGAANKLRMFRRPNPAELKPVKLLDPSIAINEMNKSEYFDSGSRKQAISGLEELVRKAEDFVKSAFDGAVPEDILPKVDSVRGALIPVRQLLKEAREEDKAFTETESYFVEIAKADETAFSKLLKSFEEQVEAEKQDLRFALKIYLMNILRHSYAEAKAAAELAQMNAAIPPGEKGVQCNLEIDDVRDAGAFLSRITQQEKAIGQIFDSVELLLKNLEASGDRFENVLCCPRCKNKCIGGIRFISLWPCGHVVCEECLQELELELGEYLCEVCGGVCTDVLNDNLNAMVARTDFKRSGFTSFSNALEILKEELVEVDAKFIEATLSQYTASTIPSEEDYLATKVVNDLTSELTQDQISSFDVPGGEDAIFEEIPDGVMFSPTKRIASAFLSGMKKT